jgi:spore coat protein H
MNRIFREALPRYGRGVAHIVGGTAAAVGLLFAEWRLQAEAPVTVAQVEPARQAPRSAVPLRQRSASRLDANELFAVSPEVTSELPIYEIRMNAEDLAVMDENAFGEDLHPATFIADGVTYEHVKIRYRGAWARTWPKKPLKIFLSEDKPFKGQRRLNLNSSFRDPSFIRETLAYHIYQVSGAPASRSQLARVHLNDRFRGLYVQVEQPDKALLKRLDLKGAIIFKASSRMKQGDERVQATAEAYRMHYEQETQKEEDSYSILKQFCEELAQTKDALAFFEKNLDLEKYINYLAATTLCQNWDGYSKNHFLVYDKRGSKKWFLLPWDLDRALGDHWDWSFGRADLPIELGTEVRPGVTGWNRLMDRFFSHPDLRRRLADRLQQLLEKEFTIEKLGPLIDEMQLAITPEAALDYRRWPNVNSTAWWRNDKLGLDKSIKGVKQFIEDRRAFLLSELPRFRQNRDDALNSLRLPGR